MSSAEFDFPKELLSPLGNSGFPFQTAVVAAIRSVGPFAIEEEVAWRDDDGSHRFLDIVASVGQVRLCIECKALRNESLVFLLPQTKQQWQTANVHDVHLGRVQDSTRRPNVSYGVSQTEPLTAEATYCVALGKSVRDNRLIEKEVQPLVRGTEEYAKDRCRQPREADYVLCLPVLVTTARLFIAIYDPYSISLDDGIYQAREDHIQAVSFVRFAKEFTADGSERTRLRTVFVVRATHLNELILHLSHARIGSNADTWVSIYDSVGGERRAR